MSVTAAKPITGPKFSAWLDQVRAKFEVADEFSLASAIYSFQGAFEDGMSPQQAYDDFDRWAEA
jgi:hypothetical protein